MYNYVIIVSLLFMHFFAAVLCSVTQRFSMWGGTFRDDTIIGWVHKELVPDAAVLSCQATLFPVAWRDKKKLLWWRAIDWQCFSKVICCGCKIYHHSFGGIHSLLGYYFLPPDCHSFRWVFKLIMQSKQTPWYNLSSDRKKKNTKEIIFAVKIF